MDQSTGSSANGRGSGPPEQPPKTAEQLASIHAAMMEELGVGRKDTLPLEDRGYNGRTPMNMTMKPKAPANAGVARWQNVEFDDVDEADEQLDNIADGQLYRLRRGASSGPSHAPSGRGGHASNNLNRGGRAGSGIPSRAYSDRGSPARGALARATPVRGFHALGSPARGSRGGMSSGVGRGGRVTSTGDARHDDMSSSTPSTYFNDGRRGVDNHARVEKAIASLMIMPRPAPPSSAASSQPSANPAASHYALASAQDFMSAMGLKPRPTNVSSSEAPAPAFKPETKANSSGTPKLDPVVTSSVTAHSYPNLAYTAATGNPSQVTPSMLPPTTTTAASSSQRVSPLIIPAITQATTPAFANRSTGLAASRWNPEVAPTPVVRNSLNANSVSNSTASVSTVTVSTTSTPTLAAPIPAPVVLASGVISTAAPLFGGSNPLSDSNASVSSHPLNVSPAPVSVGTALPTSVAVNTGPGSQVATGSAAILAGRNVLTERVVKVERQGAWTLAKVRLVKKLDGRINLEVELGGSVPLDDPLLEDSFFKLTSATTIMINTGPHLVNILFQFPHIVLSFEKLLAFHVEKRPDSIPKDVKIADSPTVETPSASIGRPVADLSESRKESAVLTDLISSNIPETNLAEAVYPDSATANKVAIVGSGELLIDVSEHCLEERSLLPQGGSALDDLALIDMSKNPVVYEIVSQLNNVAGGSFLYQITINVLSEETVLSTAEKLVLAFLKNSNIFNLLPEHISTAYMKNISKEVLKLAKTQASAFENIEARTNINGDIPKSADDDSAQVSNPQRVNVPEQLEAPQQLNNSQSPNAQQLHGHQWVRKRKYSVVELVTLRDQATVKEELVVRTEKLNIDGKSPKPAPKTTPRNRNSKAETAARLPSQPNQGTWDLKPANSKVAAGPSTSTVLSSMPPVTQQVEPSTSQNQHQKTDPALYGALLSAIGKKSSQTPSVPQVSRGLNITPPSSYLAAIIPPQTNQAVQSQTRPSQTMAKQESVLKVSAQPFSPTQPASQPAAQVGQTPLTFNSATSKSIYETSNNKEDMEKARVPGLSASKWSIAATPVSCVQPLQRFQQHYQPATGPEVVVAFPVVAQQMISTSRRQENVSFQNMASFPPRPEMYNHRPSNASSTASDYKAGHPLNFDPTSPSDPPRQALSPRKNLNLQARLDSSLANRNGSTRGR